MTVAEYVYCTGCTPGVCALGPCRTDRHAPVVIRRGHAANIVPTVIHLPRPGVDRTGPLLRFDRRAVGVLIL